MTHPAKKPSATPRTAAPGVIRADEVYLLAEFEKRTGLGKWARRLLRRNGGLRPIRIGNVRFVRGADFLALADRLAIEQAGEVPS